MCSLWSHLLDTFMIYCCNAHFAEGRLAHGVRSRLIQPFTPVWCSSEKPLTVTGQSDKWVSLRLFLTASLKSDCQPCFTDEQSKPQRTFGVASPRSSRHENSSMRKLANCGGLLPIFSMNRPSLWERPVFPHLQLQALTHNQFQKNTEQRVKRQGFSNMLKNAVLLDSEQDRGKRILRTGDTLGVCSSCYLGYWVRQN